MFAVIGGMPISSSVGKVIRVPEPTIVLIVPAADAREDDEEGIEHGHPDTLCGCPRVVVGRSAPPVRAMRGQRGGAGGSSSVPATGGAGGGGGGGCSSLAARAVPAGPRGRRRGARRHGIRTRGDRGLHALRRGTVLLGLPAGQAGLAPGLGQRLAGSSRVVSSKASGQDAGVDPLVVVAAVVERAALAAAEHAADALERVGRARSG